MTPLEQQLQGVVRANITGLSLALMILFAGLAVDVE
jgi:hypothetical protein